jgi:hypothetical protein
MSNRGNSNKNTVGTSSQDFTRSKNKLKVLKRVNKANPVKLKKVFKMVKGKLPLKLIEPSVKVFGKYNFNEYLLNTIKLVKQLKYNYNNYMDFSAVLKVKLFTYAIVFKLFEGKFLSQTKISKFVGRSQIIKKRRRKKWLKSFKTKVPYYYLNASRRSTLPKTYTKLKLYKLFWANSDIFQSSTLNFIKRYAVFGKRSKMLKNILKRIIKKSKKKKTLKKYKYNLLQKGYTFKKNSNINTVSGLFSGITNTLTKVRKQWKTKRMRKIKTVTFKKFFFKTLIEGRKLVKLVLRRRYKRKNSFSNMISASTHTTFFNRLHKLEFSLFNIVLRSRFTTSLRDTLNWVNKGLIFVNSTPCINPYASLGLGDRVQLMVTNSYFIYKKTYFTKNRKDVAKLRSKLWLKNHGSFNLFRKRSKCWPQWILRTAYYKSIVPNFLEVDYLTLSAVIVCLPKNIIEYDSILWRYLNVYNFRLYNWKVTN